MTTSIESSSSVTTPSIASSVTNIPTNNTYTINDAVHDDFNETERRTVPGNSSYSNLTRDGKKVVIFSDSMCKGINNGRLNRSLVNKTMYKKVFPGATPEDVDYYSVRTLTNDCPDITVIHTGTNQVGKKDPFEIARGIIKNVITCKELGVNKVFVSGVIMRKDYPEQVRTLNNILEQWQFLHDYTFIYNENITEECLAWDQHHLNNRGSLRLSANFRRALNKPWV